MEEEAEEKREVENAFFESSFSEIRLPFFFKGFGNFFW